MSRSRTPLSVALCVATSFLSPSAHAGVLLKKNVQGEGAGESTTKIDTNFYRVDGAQGVNGGNAILIYDRSKNAMFFFMDDKDKGKLYYEISKAAMEEARKDPKLKAAAEDSKAKVDQSMKSMQEMMSKMDPKQRAMVEKMMPKGGMPKSTQDLGKMSGPEYKKLAGSKTIAGYSCENWEVTQMGRKTQTVCGAKKFVPIEKYMPLFTSAQELGKDWAKFISEMTGVPMPQGGASSIFESLKRVGMPLETETLDFMTGKVKSTETLASVTDQSFNAGDFAHPSGYKKVSFFEVLKGKSGK